MFTSRRRRMFEHQEHTLQKTRRAVLSLLFISILFFTGKSAIGLFGHNNQIQRSAALLMVGDRNAVNVSLEGGTMQRAEDGLKLYPGDRITTSLHADATLHLFDGSRLRIDEESELLLKESTHGSTESLIDLDLLHGTLWIASPSKESFSGSIVRSVTTPYFSLSIPSNTEALVTEKSLTVFAADGIGVGLSVPSQEEPIYIGEGQTLTLPPAEERGNDLYVYRSPFDARLLESSFLQESRLSASLPLGTAEEPTSNNPPIIPQDILTVIEPADSIVVSASTVKVSGTIATSVDRVRINGYQAEIDTEKGTFALELALPNEKEITIHIEALDTKGIAIGEAQRIIQKDINPPPSPVIVSPAAHGTTWRTQKTEFEIRGEVNPEVVGIVINDYRLQLFRQGDKEWGYLASIELGNLVYGKNVFNAYSIDASGNWSEPATITILVEEGEEGIVAGEESSASSSTESPSTGTQPQKTETSENVPEVLPNNDPLMPGTLSVTSPTTGAVFETDDDEFSIYGTAPPETLSVWVNGYKLRLYKPGSSPWKYIASYPMLTMKRGRNVYNIILRNEQGEVLDRMEYTVVYRVKE